MPNYYVDPVWNTWTTNSTTTVLNSTGWSNLGSASSTVVWNNWNSIPVITYTTSATEPEIEEQRAEINATMERQRLELIERRHARDEQRQGATSRARILLRSILSQEQWETWEAEQFIEVQGSEGNWFRLRPGSNGNITVFDDDGDIERICAHPNLYDDHNDPLPNEDVLVGQILALRTDENNFRRIANVHRRFRVDIDELSAA